MNKNKILKYFLMFLQYGFAIVFLLAGISKILGIGGSIAEFNTVGFGQWFRYFIALWEISGAILLLMPRTRYIGAGLVFLASIGAFLAQEFFLHMDIVHTLVFIFLTGLLVWQDRKMFVNEK